MSEKVVLHMLLDSDNSADEDKLEKHYSICSFDVESMPSS